MTPAVAARIEQLGFGALWLGGSPRGDLVQVEELLDGTSALTLATGIVNIWQDEAAKVAASFIRVESRHPGRFLLGVGAGHREATRQYARPYETIRNYIDVLHGEGVPAASLVLAALGPKMLRLAAERTAGAHPYLVTPEYAGGLAPPRFLDEFLKLPGRTGGQVDLEPAQSLAPAERLACCRVLRHGGGYFLFVNFLFVNEHMQVIAVRRHGREDLAAHPER